MKRIVLSLVGCAGLMLAAANYKLLTRHQIPGDGSWDYLSLDESSQRLYVSQGGQLHVMDTARGTVIGSVPTKGMHGYFPAAPEMRSTFMIMGKGVAKARSLGEIDMRAIAPTLAKAMGGTLPGAEKPAINLAK